MNRLFETLEGRWMLSGTPLGMSVHVAAQPPAVHAPLSQNVPMRFQGSAVDSAGGAATPLQMMVVKTAKGFHADVAAVGGNGKTTHFNLKLDASGQFSTDFRKKGDQFHLEGQLSADFQTVTGTFTDTRTDGSSSDTFSLSRVAFPAGGKGDSQTGGHDNGGDSSDSPSPTPPKKPEPAPSPTPTPSPSPVPTPTPAPVSGQLLSHYLGKATTSTGMTVSLTMALFKTADGSLVGVVAHPSASGGTATVAVKFDASGHFVLDGTDQSPRLEGQLSSDMKTLTGTFTGTSASESGTFTLTRT